MSQDQHHLGINIGGEGCAVLLEMIDCSVPENCVLLGSKLARTRALAWFYRLLDGNHSIGTIAEVKYL